MYEEIERVLDQHVRPLLRGHGGDMEVLGLEDGVLHTFPLAGTRPRGGNDEEDQVRFRLLGKCSGCPAAGLTTEELIRAEVVERVPEVREVALVQETSRELLDQAREILRRRHGG